MIDADAEMPDAPNNKEANGISDFTFWSSIVFSYNRE
jgi:hypothetical protein